MRGRLHQTPSSLPNPALPPTRAAMWPPAPPACPCSPPQMSFGQLDPWMGGGVVRSPHRGVPAITTAMASHRQDLSA